ncbi:hypothetical protein [Hoeflea ulvae]|uniref:Ig-like domain-containing protein n=1 Tax=Hoeflea ulvae TaxID=2983764 RepID=A0ABT3YE90_9HYPH|nr:hypothetical protein [Hoeflea ulvae]MCY0094137.1 hypothetical protein [Hoeflea ulvae]
MTKLTLAAAAALVFTFTAPAFADTISLAFQGMDQSKLIFENGDNGRTLSCTMTGSGAGSVPTGCNWSIGVDISTMEGNATLSAGNDVCQISCSSE